MKIFNLTFEKKGQRQKFLWYIFYNIFWNIIEKMKVFLMKCYKFVYKNFNSNFKLNWLSYKKKLFKMMSLITYQWQND